MLELTNFIMVSDSGKNFQEKREILQGLNSKARQRTVRVIWTIERNLKEFQPESSSNPNMRNPKDKEDSGTMGEGAESACHACQAARDLSHERNAALSKWVAEAVAKEMAKAHIYYQALLNEKCCCNANQP